MVRNGADHGLFDNTGHTMEHREYRDALQHLLSTINVCAPTGNVQRAFVTMLHEMEDDNLEPKQILKRMVGSLYDGLAYGNWIGQI